VKLDTILKAVTFAMFSAISSLIAAQGPREGDPPSLFRIAIGACVFASAVALCDVIRAIIREEIERKDQTT
jgi:hypothetical protein